MDRFEVASSLRRSWGITRCHRIDIATKANDNAEPAPEKVELIGNRSFQLPLCWDADIEIGEHVAIVTFRTSSHQQVLLPMSFGTLLDLGQVVSQAIIDIADDEA